MPQKHRTLVIKIGTSSLPHADGSFAPEKARELMGQTALLKQRGDRVVLVSAGAIAAGFRLLGHTQRPKAVAAKQAAAAVGQGRLIEEYTAVLAEHGCVAAQLLLTRGDFTDKRRYDNVFRALTELLDFGAVPIINENDTTSIEELRFGDNDTLSAQVAAMIHADLLLLLTDVPGLYTADPRTDPAAKHIDRVEAVTAEIEALGGGAASALSSGGMRSKISAAALATAAGVPVYISSSKEENALLRGVDRESPGTYFAASQTHLKTRLQWVAFYTEGKGRLYIDSGAAAALTGEGRSLLPSGVVAIEGDFARGDVVDVYSSEGKFLGRGLSGYDKAALAAVKGKHGAGRQAVALHRNDWVGAEKIRLIRDEEEEGESGHE
jgi:glutamate 5-kinase